MAIWSGQEPDLSKSSGAIIEYPEDISWRDVISRYPAELDPRPDLVHPFED